MTHIRGGVLILLTEPHHPWFKGVSVGISNCRSLDSLNEGLQIGSKGLLSLTNGVSLIDLRPLLVKDGNPAVGDDKMGGAL